MTSVLLSMISLAKSQSWKVFIYLHWIKSLAAILYFLFQAPLNIPWHGLVQSSVRAWDHIIFLSAASLFKLLTLAYGSTSIWLILNWVFTTSLYVCPSKNGEVWQTGNLNSSLPTFPKFCCMSIFHTFLFSSILYLFLSSYSPPFSPILPCTSSPFDFTSQSTFMPVSQTSSSLVTGQVGQKPLFCFWVIGVLEQFTGYSFNCIPVLWFNSVIYNCSASIQELCDDICHLPCDYHAAGTIFKLLEQPQLKAIKDVCGISVYGIRLIFCLITKTYLKWTIIQPDSYFELASFFPGKGLDYWQHVKKFVQNQIS